jgi:3-(3-hydroxy-phenyl)propionate hydroxylase
VIDAKGVSVRLDDVLDGRWTVLHTGPLPVGAQAWADVGAQSIRLSGSYDATIGDGVRDSGATLIAWMTRKKSTALVVRPDGFVYAAAAVGQPLPVPPAGFTGTTALEPLTPIQNGVTA